MSAQGLAVGGLGHGPGMWVRLENMKINCRLKPNPAATAPPTAHYPSHHPPPSLGAKQLRYICHMCVCNFHFMFGRKNAESAIKCTHTQHIGQWQYPGPWLPGLGRTIRWKGPLNATKWIYLPDRDGCGRPNERPRGGEWGPARNVNTLWVNKAQNEIYATWPTTDKSERTKCRSAERPSAPVPSLLAKPQPPQARPLVSGLVSSGNPLCGPCGMAIAGAWPGLASSSPPPSDFFAGEPPVFATRCVRVF